MVHDSLASTKRTSCIQLLRHVLMIAIHKMTEISVAYQLVKACLPPRKRVPWSKSCGTAASNNTNIESGVAGIQVTTRDERIMGE